MVKVTFGKGVSGQDMAVCGDVAGSPRNSTKTRPPAIIIRIYMYLHISNNDMFHVEHFSLVAADA
jgi:hypothetical protein